MTVRNHYMPSTTLRSFTYDRSDKKMVITFAGGLIKEYENIPLTVAWGLRGADDKGDYYRSRIRNRFRPVATYW